MVLQSISKKQKIILLAVFLFCFFVQVIPVIRSGLHYSFGVGFWGPNGHDGVWHLSLINHISNPTKIKMPIFAGEYLKNYHPFFDILIAFLSKITFINSSLWLFQIFPIITTILYLYFSFLLGQKITKKFNGGIILMLLNSISNSFGWVVSFIKDGSFGGESLFWAMQSPSNQLNPPFMLSILLILVFIYLLTFKQPSKIAIFFLLVFLPIIKVYSAVPAFIIFFFYIFKNRRYLPTFITTLFVSGLLFLIYNRGSAGLIEFKPFWFINSLFDSIDRLYFPKLSAFRNAYGSIFLTLPKLIIYYTFGILTFILGNFSWRILASKEIIKNKTYFLAISICCLIPLFFIQKGTSWNTIQFLYYALFLSNIFLTKFLVNNQKYIFWVVLSYLIPLISFLPNYLGKTPPAAIPSKEIEALNFLKSQPKGTVLTYPYDKYLKKSFPKTPLPLYAYETTSYVAAYSGQQTYLEDEMNLQNSGYIWPERRQASLDFFSQQNEFADRGFLVNNQISYLYLPKIYMDKIDFNDNMYLKIIYENDEVVIYQVQR